MPNYSPAIQDLVANRPQQPLGRGKAHEEKRAALETLAIPEAFTPHAVKNRDMALACLSGLWLAYNFHDESHAISQDLHTPEGSFWHAILHRREPDPWNAKYWWRKVGSHPVIDELDKQTSSLGYTFRSPEVFVDFCERVRGTGNADETIAERVQMLEWELLFDHCWRKAIGG